jgi:hypothetical protein
MRPGQAIRAELPAGVTDVLGEPGAPLDPAVQRAASTVLGHSFANVRIHTDSDAAASADAVGAHAYTAGAHIVFAPGRYRPAAVSGARLLIHELTHVVQQSRARGITAGRTISDPSDPAEVEADHIAAGLTADWTSESVGKRLATPQANHDCAVQLQENANVSSSAPIRDLDSTRLASLDELLTQITEKTQASLQLRAQIESLPPSSSQERTSLGVSLDAARSSLIDLLQQRIELLNAEVESLNARIGPVRASSAEHPETDALASELIQREEELRQHERQLQPLLRWHTRKEITSVTAQLVEIDQELTTLPQVSDPSNPAAELLALRRNELERHRNDLARTLTAGATEYKQFDPRWGALRYGSSPRCTNIKQAGCGPTSLAIVMNYLYQEDPEMLVGSSGFEIVTPPETAAYAATHGRVCNSGTAGDTMVTRVDTAWPGFTGRPISLTKAAAELRTGNLVIFLCHDCTGRTQSGGPKRYGGHFMVLSAISDDGTTYDVLDPGAAEAKDIETISHKELQTHTGGFWIVERK